jgi:hypothetical protein
VGIVDHFQLQRNQNVLFFYKIPKYPSGLVVCMFWEEKNSPFTHPLLIPLLSPFYNKNQFF